MTSSTTTTSRPDENNGLNVKVTLGISGSIGDDPLAVISGITQGIKSMEPTLREAVSVARAKRFTWDEIGAALGVTKQSAWERFSVD